MGPVTAQRIGGSPLRVPCASEHGEMHSSHEASRKTSSLVLEVMRVHVAGEFSAVGPI